MRLNEENKFHNGCIWNILEHFTFLHKAKDVLDEYLDCLPAASTLEAHLVEGLSQPLHLEWQ